MSKLRFRRHFRVERLAPDLVFLLGESEQHTLTGWLYYLLVPLLHGDHDADAIVDALADQAPPLQIHYTLSRLQKQGYVIEVADTFPPEQAAYFDLARIQPTGGARVIALGDLTVEPLSEMLTAMGLSDPPYALDVLLTEDYLHPDLDVFNRQAERPFLLVKPTGAQVWIGPVIQVGESACWACLAQRLQLNRAVETFLEQHTQTHLAYPAAALPSTTMSALSLAAGEIAYWLSGWTRLHNRLFAFDMLDLRGEWHTLIRRPQCPVCGTVDHAADQPITLQSRPKINAEGGYRSSDAAALLAQYGQHVSPITGVVSHLTRVASAEHLYVFASGYNKARSFQHWQNFRLNLRSQSAGKGTSELQAKVGALCEAIERYSGLFQGDEPRITAAYQALESAVYPADLLHYSEAQYENRQHWNQICPPHLYVPQRFDPARTVEWTPVRSLVDNAKRYVPTAYCYYDYALPDDHVFCGADSNGCAAGSSLEDAILQGFFELVERDAVAIWWYNRVQRPAVDLHTLSNPYVEQVGRYFEALEREFWLLDLTTDLEIPTFAAVSRRLNHDTEDVILGFGAHFDPQIAALRAITEMNQTLPAVLRDAQGNYQSQASWEIDWWQTATLANQPYLAPAADLRPTPLTAYARRPSDDLREDVLSCVEIARRNGFDLLVLDQTRPDVGLPVVRVIAPRLRHFWGRFAPGRLYEVPVRLGWLKQPRREDELNAKPMFM